MLQRQPLKNTRGRYDGGWDRLKKERHAKQLASGLLPSKWKLSPALIIFQHGVVSQKREQWEASRMEVFAAMVEVLDENVGRLVEKLKSMGVYDNTLISLSALTMVPVHSNEHGRGLAPWDPESYWTYDASWAHAGNTPFRLYKQNQHEGGISSPLVVHWPAGSRQLLVPIPVNPDI